MDKPRDLATDHCLSRARLTPIGIQGLSYVTGDETLLDDLTFTIPSDSKTVIMGANGAGKSLLLRLLHGLLQPTRGGIFWNGAVADRSIESRQAMVFQRPVMLRRSAAGNIAYVLKHISKSMRAVKVRAVLEDANLGHKYETPARLLSGGEQQRLAIARGMANDPDVLFLDEPTAGLDPASIFAVERMIEAAFAKGTKIVLVTHDVGQARRLADDVVFLDRGRVVETGQAGGFFSNPRSGAAKAYLKGELFL